MERKLSIRKTRLRVSDPFSSGSSSEIFYQSRLGLTGRSEIVSPFAGAAGEYLRFSANSINSIDHLRLSKLSSISDSLPSVKLLCKRQRNGRNREDFGRKRNGRNRDAHDVFRHSRAVHLCTAPSLYHERGWKDSQPRVRGFKQ